MTQRSHLLAALAAAVLGCAGAPPRPAPAAAVGAARPASPPASAGAVAAAPRPARPAAGHDAAVQKAVATARSLAGQQQIVLRGVSFGDGCAALVRAAYQEAGRPLPADATDVAAIHALAQAEGALRRSRPVAGDLVFFSDRPGGKAEHVGLVERISDAGTATVLHRTSRGVIRLHVNAAQPWKARGDDGRILNDVLVVGGGRLPAGRLLVAFATML